jgi:hypothetical protein
VSRLFLLGPIVLVALAGPAGAERAPVVGLHPDVLRLGQHATIVVSAMRTRSLEVRLAGATDIVGRPLPWQPLRLSRGVWRGSLPAPALRGVYPVALRSGPGATPFRPEHLFLRIFARGTRARPSFAAAVGAVRWWVRTVVGAKLVAVRPWKRPAFDRRELRLHRLFVVAYSQPGKPATSDRLGMFVEVFRDGYDAGWRLLEATVQP